MVLVWQARNNVRSVYFLEDNEFEKHFGFVHFYDKIALEKKVVYIMGW